MNWLKHIIGQKLSNNLVFFEQIKIDTLLANMSSDDMVQRKEIKV